MRKMKKIGYIYKYDSSEGMGILVFGIWKVRSCWGLTINNTPILFSDNDLLSEVRTGQLVYFDLNDDNTVSNIERASLSNFNVEYINSIITCKSNEPECSFYWSSTHISFERLDNIIIPNENDTSRENATSSHDYSLFTESFLDEDDFSLIDDYETVDTSTNVENYSILLQNNNSLPNSVKDLFNCFGKYKHENGEDFASINIFDLSLWIDKDVLSNDYYGGKVNELLFLYDLVVLKKHYNKNGNIIPVRLVNDCISPSWALLLSKFNDDELKDIIHRAPKLQPVLPVDFCKNNIEVLTENQGMPNVEICILYCLYKISKAVNISDYDNLKQKFHVYRNCTVTHPQGEGTPMCKMGKTRIMNLSKKLKEQYENIIKKNVISQMYDLCDNITIVDNLKNAPQNDFHKVAVFIESYNELWSNFFGYKLNEEVLNSFENLPKLYKRALERPLLYCINKSVINTLQSGVVRPSILQYRIDYFGSWIQEPTKQKIKELVNERFSKLDELEDLKDAYRADYITKKQFYIRYKQITSSYDTCQFLMELSNYDMRHSPMEVQWYVVAQVIEQLDYRDLDDYKYIKVNFKDSISNIRSLLKWLANYGNLRDVVLRKAEEKICSVLSDEDRWALFEEKIVQSPGIENIRKYLDKVYKMKSADKEVLKHTCFQKVMLSDTYLIKDPEVKLFIADNLDSKHQFLMQQNTTGFLRLHLWLKQPSSSYDWELIKNHFYELSPIPQIKLLRFIFGKMATGDFPLSFDDLYSLFVDSNTPACSAICGILFILKAKMNDMNISITSSMLESVIGIETNAFLKYSKELFYPCYGYLAISAIERNIKCQSFNGVLKKEIKNGSLCYVVYFYNSPVDIYGRTIESMIDSDYVEVAKQVLQLNIFTEVINGKYYIHESHEDFVKQFLIAYDIDDRCGLLSDKERLIELGYLPRNNTYQPRYTNYLRVYDDSHYYVCRCGILEGSGSSSNIPFFWCNKKMCVRRAHFFLPPSQWDKYCFSDLLNIVLGQSPEVRDTVWKVYSEISKFICDYKHVTTPIPPFCFDDTPQFFPGNNNDSKSNERNISSKPLNEKEERGIWNKSSSVYRAIFDDDECDEYEENYDAYTYDSDEPTYDRYNGSYAQDEMGYSDDDIDTIFDGDPSACWNID